MCRLGFRFVVVGHSSDDSFGCKLYLGGIILYDITTGEPTVVFKNDDRHGYSVWECGFIDDGVLITSGDNILIWNASNCLLFLISLNVVIFTE